MKIAIACDHDGFLLKDALIPFLKKLGHSVQDFGAYSTRPCDYPDYAIAAARAVSEGDCDKGIVLCSTGIGASIAANKIKGIRCAMANDVNTAKASRMYEDANMLALGAASLDQATAFTVAEAWLTTAFSNEDVHQERIDKIMACENQQEAERKKLEKENAQLKAHKCKKPPYRPKHFGLINQTINAILCILLIITLTLVPLASFITTAADPQTLVNAVFSSDFLTSILSGLTSGTESTSPDATETTEDTETTEAGSEDTGVSGSSSAGRMNRLDGETVTTPESETSSATDLGVLGSMDTSSLLDSLQSLIDSGVIDETTLKEGLGEDVEINMDGVGSDLLESELMKELASEYVSSVMDAALNPDSEATFTEETVKEIMDKHMDEITQIVNNNLPEGTEISQEVIQSAVSGALDAALPTVMETLPDPAVAAKELVDANPMINTALGVMKFITSGALRAIVLLIAVALCIVIAIFRLPGLHGLTTIGIASTVTGVSCCASHLIFDLPISTSLLGGIPALGAILAPAMDNLSQVYYVSGITFTFLGICLVIGTTLLRNFFGRIFHRIFAD